MAKWKWKELRKYPQLIRLWNEKMGLMETVGANQVPTALPYQAHDNPEYITVDGVYWKMIQDKEKRVCKSSSCM